MPAAFSLSDVCLMISRVCASTSTRLPLATALRMISAAMTVLPEPVGATRQILETPAISPRQTRQGGPLKRGKPVMLAASMTRTTVAILSLLAVAACTSAQMPAAWTRADGQPGDPAQLESAKTICRGEMEQAELVTNARGLVPIQLPGQDSPTLKVYIGCMARHGYTAVR